MLPSRKIRQGSKRQALAAVPIKPDLGILGHKWALVVLTDIGLREVDRFSEILRSNPGLSPRVLTLRLRELESNGMIKRSGEKPPRPARWTVTAKGADILPALVRLLVYGARWNADNPFKGTVPRRITR